MVDTYAKAAAHVQSATTDWAATNKKLYDGDHFDGGTFWVGPRPAATDLAFARTMAEIARAFVASNKISEVIKRHVAAVIGKEPGWSLTVARPLADGEEPTVEEQGLIDEAEAALTTLWDARGMHGLLQQACATLLYGARAPLRLFVPPGVLEDGRIPQADLTTALGYCCLSLPALEQATVITDPQTQQQIGLFVYQEATLDQTGGEPRAEVVQVGDWQMENGRMLEDQTIIRILGTGDTEADAVPLPLGNRLTMYEMTLPAPLITEPVRRQQMLLNMALTMLSRNVVLGGFVARIFLNANLTAETMYWGAGVTNSVVGLPIYGEDGVTIIGYTTPAYEREQPVEPRTFLETKTAAYTAILEETFQLHALISGDATASGESRKQARADFEASIGPTVAQIERATRWLLETVLAMGAAFAGMPDRFAGLRAVVQCRTNAGPISGDDQSQARENYKEGLLGRETAMSRIGVDDVDAEIARVEIEQADRDARAAALVRQQGAAQEGEGEDAREEGQ